MALVSMTGFAAVEGQADGVSWKWEARSVNARGLDIRVRLPEGMDGLETDLRKAIQGRFARGSIQVSLRLDRSGSVGAPALNREIMGQAIARILEAQAAAQAAGLDLVPISAADVLAYKGVLDSGNATDRMSELVKAMASQIPQVVAVLAEARAAEGKALVPVLEGQIATVSDLVAQAGQSAEARSAAAGDVLRTRVAALVEAQDTVDPDRLAQELALLAVKADVTEELDRLAAHIDSATTLSRTDGPVGRKLDFLMQEFNREANTLCSKSQDPDLTRIGLDLKVVVDQMREQCQNIE